MGVEREKGRCYQNRNSFNQWTRCLGDFSSWELFRRNFAWGNASQATLLRIFTCTRLLETEAPIRSSTVGSMATATQKTTRRRMATSSRGDTDTGRWRRGAAGPRPRVRPLPLPPPAPLDGRESAILAHSACKHAQTQDGLKEESLQVRTFYCAMEVLASCKKSTLI